MINLKALPLYTRNIAEYLFAREPFVIAVPNGHLWVRPRSYDLYVVGEVFYEKCYLPTLIDPKDFKPDYIVDLGAYIGDFTVWSVLEFKPKRIYAVELLPEHISLIKKNVKLNGLGPVVETLGGAVYSGPDKVRVSRSPVNMGKSKISLTGGTSEVKTFDLQHILQMVPTGNADFLKIDIEGAEKNLFSRENSELFRNNVFYISMELHSTDRSEILFYREYLEKLGYKVKLRPQFLRMFPNLEGLNINKSK